MPQKKASIKDVRRIKRRLVQNNKVRRTIKELIKDAKSAATKGDTAKAQELMRQLQKAVDKAAKCGLVKANTAARKKSRLSKAIRTAKK